MTITYLGVQNLPSPDNANDTGTTLTLDKDVSPFSTLNTNDFVLVYCMFRSGAGTSMSVTTTGGQTWTEQIDQLNSSNDHGFYTCFFNGTWTADPVFTSSGAAVQRIMFAFAFSGVDTTTPIDVAWSQQAQASASSYTEATWNTNTDGALAFVYGSSADNNTWSVDNSMTHPSGAGNIYWRTSGSGDASAAICAKTVATAGAVGQTVLTLATLGPDAGASGHFALKPQAAASVTMSLGHINIGF